MIAGRPNARAIARRIGVHPVTIQRILNQQKHLRSRDDATRGPVEEYHPSPQLIRGLQHWLGLESEADVWRAAEKAPPAAPAPRKKPGKR